MRQAEARKLREEHLQEPQRGRTLHLVREEPAEETSPADSRRTVKITGQPVPPRRRRSTAASQIEARPDRIALWAFLLGLFLVFMAVATANASV
jgi:thiol:disulfide interchange protein